MTALVIYIGAACLIWATHIWAFVVDQRNREQ